MRSEIAWRRYSSRVCSRRGLIFLLLLPHAEGAPLLEKSRDRSAPRRSGRNIMIIDDHADVRESMQHLLSEWGHTVTAARTLDEAVAVVEHFGDVDLILADYRLADNVTGVDAIHAVIARAGRDVAAVIITGDTSPERIRGTGQRFSIAAQTACHARIA